MTSENISIFNSSAQGLAVRNVKLVETTSLKDICTTNETTDPPTSSNIVPSTSIGLRAFPPEIRGEIFESAVEWAGETCNLIKALRGNQGLYFEALAIQTRVCEFTASKNNLSGIRNERSKQAKTSIRKLCISPLLAHLKPLASRFTAVELHLGYELETDAEFHIKHVLKLIFGFATICLVRLSVILCQPYDSTAGPKVVDNVNNDLGVRGLLETVGIAGTSRWFWEAPRGAVLKWKIS